MTLKEVEGATLGLELLLTVAGGNFPIFVVMIPQESGIGAGGSLSKELTQNT